ncbi:hypothetical protein [Cupriavidus pauculus]|uniref:Uncharacterized protein n=1 Tax=Cupriavidus pauculus TaxID=82633 RepID=A0A2N5C9R4_9BURK|nr:hypothetical protein [Cupriavidus pauculus]PLP98946.1 hypothetical protein CYJ10_19410 [Cupriavidus pauculus]
MPTPSGDSFVIGAGPVCVADGLACRAVAVTVAFRPDSNALMMTEFIADMAPATPRTVVQAAIQIFHRSSFHSLRISTISSRIAVKCMLHAVDALVHAAHIDVHHFAEAIEFDGDSLVHTLQQGVGPPVGFFEPSLVLLLLLPALFFAFLPVLLVPLLALFPVLLVALLVLLSALLVTLLVFLPLPLEPFLVLLPALCRLFLVLLAALLHPCVAFGEHPVHSVIEAANVGVELAPQDSAVANVAVSFGA